MIFCIYVLVLMCVIFINCYDVYFYIFMIFLSCSVSCISYIPGDGSHYVVPIGSWVRVPMPCAAQRACVKVCRCGARGLARCQPLPTVALDNCRLHDKVVKHGELLTF